MRWLGMAAFASTMEIELLEGNAPVLGRYLPEGFRVIKRVEGRLEGNERFCGMSNCLEPLWL